MKTNHHESVRNVASFGTALQSGELENTLKHADLIGSREEIEAATMAHQHVFEEMEPDHVLPELDYMCEDRFLGALNKDLQAAGLAPCDRESYGDPVKWEPGTTASDLEGLGHACAETFIEKARAKGEIPPAKKTPTTFGKNPKRGTHVKRGSARPSALSDPRGSETIGRSNPKPMRPKAEKISKSPFAEGSSRPKYKMQ